MPDETSWTLIRDAAHGEPLARSTFTHRYLPVVRAYLAARWRGRALLAQVDDAVQEVFFDCFKRSGALEHVDCEARIGFRAFLYGVVRNVALRLEKGNARGNDRQPECGFDPDLVPADESGLSTIFDRAYAKAIVREAGALHERRARMQGGAAEKRFEILRLRFFEGMPIREIARGWNVDPAHLHREYARAREEFRDALCAVVGLQEGCSGERLAAECTRLLAMLG